MFRHFANTKTGAAGRTTALAVNSEANERAAAPTGSPAEPPLTGGGGGISEKTKVAEFLDEVFQDVGGITIDELDGIKSRARGVARDVLGLLKLWRAGTLEAKLEKADVIDSDALEIVDALKEIFPTWAPSTYVPSRSSRCRR